VGSKTFGGLNRRLKEKTAESRWFATTGQAPFGRAKAAYWKIKQPTQRPTFRWVFQRLEGIHRVRVRVHGHMHDLIAGLNTVQINILRLFGQDVCQMYQISLG